MVTEEKSGAGWKFVVAVLAGLAGVGLAAFLLLDNIFEGTADDPAVPVTDVDEGEVPQDVYDDIDVGARKEDLLDRLRPALPVDTRVLERYQQRSPETVGSSCVYYEAAGGLADELYRFCFVDDELVDKTVILPDEQGPAG